jgi:hypothetical protein
MWWYFSLCYCFLETNNCVLWGILVIYSWKWQLWLGRSSLMFRRNIRLLVHCRKVGNPRKQPALRKETPVSWKLWKQRPFLSVSEFELMTHDLLHVLECSLVFLSLERYNTSPDWTELCYVRTTPSVSLQLMHMLWIYARTQDMGVVFPTQKSFWATRHVGILIREGFKGKRRQGQSLLAHPEREITN